MMAILCGLLGLMAGAAATYWTQERLRRRHDVRMDLKGVRWERRSIPLMPVALRHMRRNYPTHDLITGVRFLDIVNARGVRGDDVVRRCGDWTASVVMMDKRTGEIGRIILWTEDGAEERAWILRRVGYKVTLIDREIDEQGLLSAMAA